MTGLDYMLGIDPDNVQYDRYGRPQGEEDEYKVNGQPRETGMPKWEQKMILDHFSRAGVEPIRDEAGQINIMACAVAMEQGLLEPKACDCCDCRGDDDYDYHTRY